VLLARQRLLFALGRLRRTHLALLLGDVGRGLARHRTKQVSGKAAHGTEQPGAARNFCRNPGSLAGRRRVLSRFLGRLGLGDDLVQALQLVVRLTGMSGRCR
jgi:hypothetical protein